MDINDQIKDKKPRYNINKEAAEISALSSNEICKYEYLTGENILPSNQQQIISLFTIRKSFSTTNKNN